MKVLIADDSSTFRSMLTTVVTEWGYDAIEAEDGEEAWHVLQGKEAPKLMLIDWEMPKLDGPGLCQRIRQFEEENPVYIIMLTVRGKTNDIVAGLQAGANDYVIKPFEFSELEARLLVGFRMLEMQTRLNRVRETLAFERETIENIILKMRTSKPFDNRGLRLLDSPVEKISGDVLVSASRPDNVRHFMLGDFTGHGLMAAVGGPIVYDVFYSMTAKGLSLCEIATEMNRQLLEKMPTGMFMGAVFIELDTEKQWLKIWNCGMSDVLIYRNNKLWKNYSSSLLSLGIVKQDFIATGEIAVTSSDRVFAYSDGITETENEKGEEFGQKRLEKSIQNLLESQAEIEFLCRMIRKYRGESRQLDDITLVEVSC